MTYKTLKTNKNIGTITVKLDIDAKSFHLAILEEQYKLKIRVLNDIENLRAKQHKELSIILNKIYTLKEANA